MDLISVNNSIVNMRKTTIKARVHVIRQIVRHIKDIQKKKSKNDNQKAQNDRKISRLQSEVNIIKQLKKDDISRFALLSTTKSLPEINPEKDAGRMDKLLKERALVRLSNASVMKKEIEAFRSKYPTWQSVLPKLLKVLGKKQQKKDQISKKKKREENRLKKKTEKISNSSAQINDGEEKIPSGDNDQSTEQTVRAHFYYYYVF